MTQRFGKLRQLCFIVLLAASCGSAGAVDLLKPLKKLGSLIDDPLKLEAGTNNILESTRQIDRTVEELQIFLSKFQGELDGDIRQYIEELNAIVLNLSGEINENLLTGEAISLNIIKSAKDSVAEIESKIYDHGRTFVKCTAAQSKEAVAVVVADTLNKLGKSKPRFNFFGITFGSVEFTPQDIVDPIVEFKTIKASYLAKLSLIADSDNPNLFITTYGEIARRADDVRCFYAGQGLEIDLLKEVSRYSRLQLPWVGKTNL
jgi:hypothetical protein